MFDITKPITQKDLDDEFLRKLITLAKTRGWYGDYSEVCDFVDFAFKLSGNIPPSSKDYEPFDED